MVPAKSVVEVQPLMVSHVCFGASFRARIRPWPVSSNPKHIQENIAVFDFELSPEEMAKMASLNQEKRYFNMTYQQIKDWMENYELWDQACPIQ